MQKNMFSGEWDDNRTPKQREQDEERERRPARQLPLFDGAGEEAAEASGSVTPLSSQTSSDEANERDVPAGLSIFGDWSQSVQEEASDDLEEQQATLEITIRSPEAVYLELVQLAQEVAATVWIEPQYQNRYQAQLQLLVPRSPSDRHE